MTPMALDGLKVVEFGDFVSAPFCGKLLADLGADVIKVERPKVGDESRRYGPFPDDLPPHVDRSGLFIYMNANKRSVTLDPSTATGQDIFNALVADADILIENQQPGVMKSLGLTYEKLKRDQPRPGHDVDLRLRPDGAVQQVQGLRSDGVERLGRGAPVHGRAGPRSAARSVVSRRPLGRALRRRGHDDRRPSPAT